MIGARKKKKNTRVGSSRRIGHLYSAGGIASALHSNEAPEKSNAVVSRSGPTELIVGGSA